MHKVRVLIGCVAGCLIASPPAFAADSAAGKALFRQRCSVCHTAEGGDNGGAQGPSLIGVVDRAAASAPQFSFSSALPGASSAEEIEGHKRLLSP